MQSPSIFDYFVNLKKIFFISISRLVLQ